jgi:hypothetical protein
MNIKFLYNMHFCAHVLINYGILVVSTGAIVWHLMSCFIIFIKITKNYE